MLFSSVELEMLFWSLGWSSPSSAFVHELIDSCTVTVCSSICLWRLSISSLKGKKNRKKLLHQFWRLNNCPALQKKSFMSVCWQCLTKSFTQKKRSYLSCRRQLWRLFSGSLLTEVEGFSNSSSREAGTGQSGILTGVTGVDGFPSLFSSMRCCSNNNNNNNTLFLYGIILAVLTFTSL